MDFLLQDCEVPSFQIVSSHHTPFNSQAFLVSRAHSLLAASKSCKVLSRTPVFWAWEYPWRRLSLPGHREYCQYNKPEPDAAH